jgi:hypothetical protein
VIQPPLHSTDSVSASSTTLDTADSLAGGAAHAPAGSTADSLAGGAGHAPASAEAVSASISEDESRSVHAVKSDTAERDALAPVQPSDSEVAGSVAEIMVGGEQSEAAALEHPIAATASAVEISASAAAAVDAPAAHSPPSPPLELPHDPTIPRPIQADTSAVATSDSEHEVLTVAATDAAAGQLDGLVVVSSSGEPDGSGD